MNNFLSEDRWFFTIFLTISTILSFFIGYLFAEIFLIERCKPEIVEGSVIMEAGLKKFVPDVSLEKMEGD